MLAESRIWTQARRSTRRLGAYPAEQHVIVYQLKEETLYIARILHGSMAFKRHELIDPPCFPRFHLPIRPAISNLQTFTMAN